MVHLPNLGKLPVKAEREDFFDEDYVSYSKRLKIEYPIQERITETSTSTGQPQSLQYNLINQPSPLGLRLKKSPSFLDFVQTKLSQSVSTNEEGKLSKINSSKDASNSNEKLKASNFPASLLRIGDFERVSRYEGDLVGKCYFAKHKLVWEVLDGGLKSKIEIQWSEISAIKASFPKEGPETLEVVLSRPPLFFRETNPQPRKHTLWQATSDFTGGQASLHRRHYVESQQGFMIKHFEKLIRCDPRLYALSQQQEIKLDNPLFEPNSSVFEEQERFIDSNNYEFRNDPSEFENQIQEPNLPNPGNNIQILPNQFKLPGLRPSISKAEIMNQIGHHIYKQINNSQNNSMDQFGNAQIKSQCEELAHCLLNDSQNPMGPTDEKYLMSRVDSLCCLIQRDDAKGGVNDEMRSSSADLKAGLKGNDSFADFLTQLPRIASYPHFL